ncbi:MAG: DNA polymerase III subunit alpha [Syntrophobacteraceae bacterium]
MNTDFVHLHVHSSYSMMQGVSAPEILCREAKNAGYSHLALTDTNGFYGVINFLEAARSNGIEPIVGAEIKSPLPPFRKGGGSWSRGGDQSAIVIAKTAHGYEVLSDLLTCRHLDDSFSLIANLPERSPDLLLLSTTPELVKALHHRVECFLEIVPDGSDRELLRAAKEIGIPPVATNAVNFAREEDYPLHRLVRAINLNKTMSTLPPEQTAGPGQWLKSPEKMAAHFPNCLEALANAVKIAQACHTARDYFETVFPYYLGKNEDHFALLLSACRKGISWRFGHTNEMIENRLLEELDLIRTKGFVDYFLVVADIVRRRPIHCGRGSGAASLVSYLLGITHVDPIRHKLLFGRFLNPERKDLPDIDVDFPWDERDELFEEIMVHYGSERMAIVSNHVGFQARGSVREVAKVYGIPAAEIKEVTRRMNFWAHPENLWNHIKAYPKFHNFPLDPPWPEIIDMASRLESLPRNIGTHCGGMVLVPDRVSRYVPVQISAKGARIIQWEKDQAEKGGLVKIDLLGNRSLAVIRDTLASIRENTGKSLDYPNLNPVDDPPTMDLLRRGKTMGVFYVESPSMRLLQEKSRTGDFEHLVIHSSIIRPAANKFIITYLRRLHGEPYEPLHPSLKDILAENFGILVYQEDVVQAAMALAGFTWGEADRLRKVISKKSREQLSSYRALFAEGCARNGVTPEVVASVWEMFTSFSGYSFCKPHSASYALVSFKSAYLKVHHPAEFMAAVLSNGGGYYSTFAYISEARRMGLQILGPDINKSRLQYTGFNKDIRIGFQQLQGIKKSTVDAILSERNERGPFLSIENLLDRITISSADVAILAKSGALDSIAKGLNRPQILWFIEAWLNRNSGRTIKTCMRNRTCKSNRIYASPPFPRGGPERIFTHDKPLSQTAFLSCSPGIKVPLLPDFSDRQKWAHEAETLGFVLSVHPMDLAEPFFRSIRQTIIPSSDFAAHIGKKIWAKGWPVTRKEVLTKEGEEMEFFTFEDKSGIFETVFFPKPFRRFCQDLDMSHAYLIHGRVESEFDVVSLTAEYAYRVQEKIPDWG